MFYLDCMLFGDGILGQIRSSISINEVYRVLADLAHRRLRERESHPQHPTLISLGSSEAPPKWTLCMERRQAASMATDVALHPYGILMGRLMLTMLMQSALSFSSPLPCGKRGSRTSDC